MSGLGVVSYSVAALAYGVLTALLVTSWRGRWQGAHLIVAIAMSAIWAVVLLAESASGPMPFLALYWTEVARDTAWVFALAAIAGNVAPRLLVTGARVLCGAFLLLPFILIYAASPTFDTTLLLSRAGLVLSLVSLVLLEQIHRNATLGARRSLKYFTIGVGALFAYDLFLYSQTELLRGVSLDAWNARGVLNALAVPLIALAARRNPHWSLDVFVSRQAVFHTMTFVTVGIYLLVMALGGYYVRRVGGAWGDVGQIVFFAGAVIVLVSLLASATLRRHAQVFISKHFYRNKYDYRVEWLRFIGTLSSTDEGDVRQTAVRAVAQIFGSPGGILFLRRENEPGFAPYAAWPMPVDSIPGLSAIGPQEDLPEFLARTRWIIDTQEYRRSPNIYGNIVLPPWLLQSAGLRIVTPLLQLDQLLGFVVLHDPPPPFELNYEDRDLLRTVGRHVATHIAQADADRRLAESRQFEAYNRLTAFMMHDLKNSIAQLKLIVANAARHKHNPEFVDDAIGTIANTADRMTRLMEQLRGSPLPEKLQQVELAHAVREAVGRCAARPPAPALLAADDVWVRANQERLTVVLEHILRNAQDATDESGRVEVTVRKAGAQALVSVSDTGSGMDAQFVRDRLFRPFDSTKGAKGMGIGAYQVREYVLSLGGNVEVQSSPGHGTRFLVSLPVAEPAGARAPQPV